VSDNASDRKPANLLPFDYHHEKVALTRMAHWLIAAGWDAQLSVRPDRAFSDGDLGGLAPEQLSEDFKARFNSDDDWRYRYTFYRDQPGNFDLVARRGDDTLIVDAKGRSSTNRRGAVAQMIGSLTLSRRNGSDRVRYGILIPDGSSWDAALVNTGGLDWVELYRMGAAEPGDITQDDWNKYQSEDSAPA
jgi:hypothetical protein